jgi:nucleoside-diphosphate-sugar epimerase
MGNDERNEFRSTGDMIRALVTGATGFLGTHLVRELLRQGFEVTCLRRATSDVAHLGPLRVRMKVADVTQAETLPSAIEGADVVFHLAGLTRALHPGQLAAVNAAGTRHLLAACAAQAGPPVVVLVSSLAAAGPSLADRPREENAPAVPVSHYGRSKRAAEVVAHEFADRLPITVVRPPLVFGQGDRSVLAIFRPIRRWGVHLVPGFVDRRLSLIHATDLATALVAAARNGTRLRAEMATVPAEGPRILRLPSNNVPSGQPCRSLEPENRIPSRGYYHVACDEHPTYAELGCRASLALGRGAVVLRTPQWLAWATAGVSELAGRLRRRPLVFNWDKAREATAGSWTCSPERVKRELGWSCAADLDARLRETIAWYREQGWL